jgi:radical SAM superfamily enzyme YgiQ (UPF0313 family)
MKVLLISPETPSTFWSFQYVLRFVSKRAVFPPLGLLTIASMLPHSWQLKMVDLNVTRLRTADIRWADYVMISGMIVHRQSVRGVVARCRALGRTVIGGGPLFTTGYEEFANDVHTVIGEAEDIIPQLVQDMESGTLKPTYQMSDRPDIRRTPTPRWDLIKLKHYVTMPLQFSRGCPYNCEFCDIIIMNGRTPRTKSPQQMLAELESLRQAGWIGQVFIVDDNFIGNKVRVKQFLRELIHWRRRTKSKMGFFTEASVNLADDAELLDLMAQAGFRRVFLGVETPNATSLEECQKQQNTRRDMAEAIRTIQAAGMEVMGGFIVGFDSDPENIFELQYDFIQRTGIVTAMVGLLMALPKTQLYNRLVREGRLRADASGNNTQSVLNFEPKLDREFLIAGYRRLMRALYEPNSYYRRVLTFLANYRPQGPKRRLTWSEFKAFLKSTWLMGVCYRGRFAYWMFFTTALMRYPEKISVAMTLAIYGHHFRRVADTL